MSNLCVLVFFCASSSIKLAHIRQQLIEAIDNGQLTMAQVVRRMRKITGMNQKAYAKKIIGISPRVLAEIERGVANPTIETLNRIGRPFGYVVGFVHK